MPGPPPPSSQEFSIAVGKNGTILTSLDASTWTKQTSGTSNDLTGICASPYFYWKFVCGKGGTILQSGPVTTSNYSNIGTWTALTTGISTDLNSIASNFGGTSLVAVGKGGTIIKATVSEGFAGSSISVGSFSTQTSGTTEDLNGITSCFTTSGTLYIAVGNNGVILTSPDGVTWTSQTSGTTNTLYEVAYNTTSPTNKYVVIVGANGTYLTSSDGMTWA